MGFHFIHWDSRPGVVVTVSTLLYFGHQAVVLEGWCVSVRGRRLLTAEAVVSLSLRSGGGVPPIPMALDLRIPR